MDKYESYTLGNLGFRTDNLDEDPFVYEDIVGRFIIYVGNALEMTRNFMSLDVKVTLYALCNKHLERQVLFISSS